MQLECPLCAISVIRCNAEKRSPSAVFNETPYGTHVPVEEPSTASKADLVRIRYEAHF
jgi:hypothetical protein